MELQQHIQRKEEDCVKRGDESKGGIKRGKGGRWKRGVKQGMERRERLERKEMVRGDKEEIGEKQEEKMRKKRGE